MVLAAAFLCLAAAVFLAGEAASAPARSRRARLRRAADYGRIRLAPARDRLPLRERVGVPLAASLARLVLRISPRQNLEEVSSRLIAAGVRGISASEFLAAKGALAATGLVFGFVLGAPGSGVQGALLFGLAFGAAGYVAPGFLVSTRARRRKEQILSELPDALDLLAVSVEAGLGFDGAISKLTEHMDGPLTEEFALALGEMHVGESRENALRKMADRIDTPETAAFVRSIVQADQLGISLGRILRVQAADSRLKRQAAAEERAMKAPIKMLFPTVAFVFPAMFIVVLGPAFLSLGKLFGF